MNSLTGWEGRERLLGVLGKLLVVDVGWKSAGMYPVCQATLGKDYQ